MLKKASSLRLDELRHHVAEDGANSVEALVSSANVVEAIVIKQNLLHNEDGDSLAKFRASLHDSQAERDNLGGEEEVDDFRGVVLDERANHTEARESQVFKRPRLGCRVEERVEEERDVR